MIKPLLAFLLAIGLGCAVGYAFFSFEASNTPEPFFENQWSETTSKGSNYAAQLVVTNDFHDFGEMKANKEHPVTVGISNEGRATLLVWFAGDPPRTVQTDFPKGQQFPLAENQVKELNIVVTPTQSGEDYRKVLILNSSDLANSPKQLTLVGQVTGGVVADRQIAVLKLDADPKPVQLKVYSYEHDDLKIESVEFSKDEPKDFTEIAYEKMSSEDLAAQDGAKSGQIVTFKISPELPRNIRRINLKLATDAEGYSPIGFSISINK